MKNVEQEIKTITYQMFGIKGEEIHVETRLKEDLGLDSLDTIEWVLELETEFNISIPDEDAMDFKKIGEVVQYIEKYKARQSLHKHLKEDMYTNKRTNILP
jgi:acyl carrier protein